MKDLDFDELDRAVNSLIANGPSPDDSVAVKNTTITQNELPKTPINSHFADNIKPIAPSTSISTPRTIVAAAPTTEYVNTPSPIVSPAPQPATPAVAPVDSLEIKPIPTIPIFAAPEVKPVATRRNSGRFMDVMHPSSDMRTTLIMPDRVSRQGTTIHLTPPAVHTPDRPVVSEPVAVVDPQPAIEARPLVPENVPEAWPDPINFSEKVEINLPVPIDDKEPVDDDIDRISDDIDNTLKSTPEIQESPFLSGAKVTKRPLGAFSGDNPIEYIETNPVNPEVVAEKVQASGNIISNNNSSQIDVDMPLPAELRGDLLSIEAASEAEISAAVAAAQPVVTAPPVAVPRPAAAPAPVVVQSSETLANNTAPKPNPVADGPTSIAQQYQEKPNTGDQNSAAIYDTAAYHKAIVGKSNKKSHLFLIIWVLSLLAVGAGVGAGIYFFVLPLL